MKLQDFWINYKNEILLIVVTSIATLVFSKLLPWIWKNLLMNPFMWIAKRISHQWEKRGFEIEYLSWLIEDNKYLQVRGLRMQTVISPYLDSIFIPLQATASLHISGKEQEKRNTAPTLVSASEMITSNKRVVILGDPGSGKTTLLRYLVLNYARLLRNSHFEGDKPNLIRQRLGLNSSLRLASSRNYGENSLPIYISLRSIPVEQLRKPNLKLEDLIFGRHLSYPKGYLDEKLRNGKCVFFLDGLDEVSINERSEVVDWVEDLVCAYPDNKYVVTSRVVGYTNPLTNGFTTYKLEDFSDNDIERFIKQWYMAVETPAGKLLTDRSKILEQADDLIGAIFDNNQVRLLAVNPLLLSIIALVHRARVRLPEKRVDLYDECTIVLLGYWDQAKGLFGKLQPSQKRAILEALAYEMQRKRIKEITTEDLTTILQRELPKYGGSLQDAIHFLEEIKERSGLLVERGTNIFSFSHLTFQEYLVARCLTRTYNSIEIILENIRDDQWQEVILLYCGMQDPSLLVRHILDFQDDMFFIWTTLAGQCVADALFVSETLRKEILDKLIKIATKSEFSPLRFSMMKICSKIDSVALLNVVENEFRQLPNSNTNVISDSFPLLIDYLPDSLCVDFLANNDLRLPILGILSNKREISDQLFEILIEKLPELNEKEKLAFEKIVEYNPKSSGLEVLKRTLIYDGSEQVRSRAIKIIGKHDDPKVLALLGLSILDTSGMVITQVITSFIDIVNLKSDKTLLRYTLVSSFDLLKNFRIKEKRPQSSLALVGGGIFGLGVLIIRLSKFLKINIREDRKDFIAKTLWSLYRYLISFFATIGKVLLSKTVHHNDLIFWTAYYQSIIMYSLNDPKSSIPFKSILPTLQKKYLDYLGENLPLLNEDFALIEKLIEFLITRIVDLDDLWGLVKAMESLSNNNHELALSLASGMVKNSLMPVRGEGIFTIYQLREFIDKEHLEILASAAKDETYDIRQISAWAIAEIKDLQTKELILDLLKDKEAAVLSEIIDAIGKIGMPEYIENIRPFLTHEDNDVRNTAYDALWKIAKKNKITIPSLSENL